MDSTLKDLIKFVVLYTIVTAALFFVYIYFEIDLPILLNPRDAVKVMTGLGLVLSLLIRVLINKIKGE